MALLIQLHEQRGRLVTQAREALDTINSNTDDSRVAELEGRHDTIMGELDTLDRRIARELRQETFDRTEQERRDRQRPTGDDLETRGQDGDRQPTGTLEERQTAYSAAFYALASTGFDPSELTPEQRSLVRRGYGAIEQEQRVQVAGTAIAGGYTVPVQLANEIVRSMRDWGPMYDGALVREITTGSGNEFDIPTNDDTSKSASALAEGGDVADDNSGDLEFGQKRLDAFVYATPWVKLSFELLQDSAFGLEAFLSDALGERLGRLANLRLTTGTGVNQPNGIVTASSLGKTAASATAIAADELIDLQHSVNAAYRRSPKCRWQFADTTLASIRKLKDGQGNYLWQMGDIRVGAPDLLLQKPYSINDDVPAIATGARAVIFGDHGRYWVRKVGSPLIGTVRERFWPKVGMAGLIRFDGELVDQAAVKHLKLA